MGNYKYLIQNIGLMTLGNFATKLLSFFLVPLYTNVLSTSEYGIYDLLNTTIAVLIPVLTLNIMESVLRFSLENKNDRQYIFSLALKYIIFGTWILIFLVGFNWIFDISLTLKEYSVYFFLMFVSQTLAGVLTSFARGTDKIADLAISSFLAAAVMIFLNVFFLLIIKIGLDGYFLANIMGALVQCIYLIIKIRPSILKKVRNPPPKLEISMLRYSTPLIVNSISFWLISASTRYVVTWFYGLSANGVYSVASKIPSILNVFQVIFSQAWTLSAVKDFDADDKNNFFSNTYRAYQAFIVISCSFIMFFNKILAYFLYADEFFYAWKYVPWLTIAIVFSSISGYLGGIFSAVKNSKIFAVSTTIGAIINLLLSIILTPIIGPIGAAIATAASYYIVLIIRIIQVKKYIDLKIRTIRDSMAYLILVIQGISFLIFIHTNLLYIVLFILEIIIIFLYKHELIEAANRIYAMAKRKN